MMTVPEYNIQKTEFEKQKKELKTFAEQPATSTELNKFSTIGQWSDFWSGGIVGVLSGHKVTGEELNSLVTKLQSCFAEINERYKKVIKEFGQVYETFEALDKGYIQGILIGIKSAEKASQEAKDAQKDIDDTIKALQITINKLKEFKDEIKNYKHLKDIDKIWGEIRQFETELKNISKTLKNQEANLNDKISKIEKFKLTIEKQKHLNDIDSMWNTVQDQGKKIDGFPARLKELSDQLTEKINEMLTLKTEFEKMEHFKDIDIIWKDTKKLQNEVSKLTEDINKRIGTVEGEVSKVTEIIKGQNHFGDIDKIWDELQEVQSNVKANSVSIGRFKDTEERVGKDIAYVKDFITRIQKMEHLGDIDAEWDYSHGLGKKIEETGNKVLAVEKEIREYEEKLQRFEDKNLQLRNRINKAYIIAGGALGVSVIQIVLQLAGIL